MDGDSGKRKIRLRWYGEKDKISNAYLEIKEKKGYESSKKKYRFKEADEKKISDYNDLVEIKKILHNKYFFIKDLNPILTTHYKRLYFISDNNLIRATVDTNLKSTLLNNYKLLDICKNYNDTVLEIKYGLELDAFVRQKLKNITLRLVKNSKYINSIISRPFYYS